MLEGSRNCHKPPDGEDKLVKNVLEITHRQKMIRERMAERQTARARECVCVSGYAVVGCRQNGKKYGDRGGHSSR